MKTNASVKRSIFRRWVPPHKDFPATADATWHIQKATVRRILRGPRIQTKLTVGAPDDAYEREADQVADEVMRMPEPHLQRAPT